MLVKKSPACQILFLGGYVDGEGSVAAALRIAGWPAGCPVTKTASGYVRAAANDVVGIALQSSEELSGQVPVVRDAERYDVPNAPLNLGVGKGANKYRMVGSVVAGSIVYPFKSTPSSGGAWVVGQKIYIAADNTWDNAPAAGTDQAYGSVDAIIGLATAATGLEISIID